jgi:hypothetical protein
MAAKVTQSLAPSVCGGAMTLRTGKGSAGAACIALEMGQ